VSPARKRFAKLVPFFAVLGVAAFCPQRWNALLTLILIALGSVHGAFDLTILIRRFPPIRALVLIATYALTTALGFLLYRGFPIVGAGLLLVLSAWHFGLQQVHARLRFATGALMLTWVIMLHTPLRYLITDAHFPPPSNAQYWCSVAAALMLATLLTWQLQRTTQLATVVIVEWLFWLALVPLMPAPLWFGCFFVLQHSREHFKALSNSGYLGASDIFLAILALAALALFAGYFWNQIIAELASHVILPSRRSGNTAFELLLPLWIAPLLLGLTIAHSALIDGLKPLYRDDRH
jgi:hypothetical protein